MKKVKAGETITLQLGDAKTRKKIKVHNERKIELVEPSQNQKQNDPAFKDDKWKGDTLEICPKWFAVRGLEYVTQ